MLLWIACVALNAAVFTNWLFLEYPRVYAPCGQAVAVLCGLFVVLTCLFVAKFLRDMSLPMYRRRKLGYTVKFILAPVLVLMATVVLGTVRLCGVRNLSALAIAMPTIVLLCGSFPFLIVVSLLAVASDFDVRCFFCFSWVFELAAIACVTLFVLTLDGYVCFSWAVVVALFAVSVTSFVAVLYVLGGHILDERA